MDFIYLLRVLLKRKWIIIGAAILAAAAAYYLTRNEPKQYRSSAQVSTGYAIKEDIQVNNQGWDPYAAEAKFHKSIVTLTSPSVLSLISYELILHDLNSRTPFRRLTPEQMKQPAISNVNLDEAKRVFQNRLDSMTMLTSYIPEEKKLLEFLSVYGYGYKSIESQLAVFRLQRTDYLQIDYLSENPELSAFVVNNVFQQFLRYYKGVRQVQSTESIDTLKSIMDKKRQDLDVKIALVNKMGGGYDPTIGASTMDVAGELRKSLEDERAKKNQKDFELRRVNAKLAALGGPVASSPKGMNNGDLLAAQKASSDAYDAYLKNTSDKALEDRYNRLNTEYLNKLNTYNSSHDNTDATVSHSTESKADLLDKKQDLEFQIQGINKNLASYESEVNQLEAKASVIAGTGQTVETLKKERDLANQEWLQAKQRYNEATTINGSSVNNFRQTVYGQPAIDPEPSKRKMIVGMAGGSALGTTMPLFIFF